MGEEEDDREGATGELPAAVFMRIPVENWYSVTTSFWAKQPSTPDGMLGGFGQWSDDDLRVTHETIGRYQQTRGLGRERVVDCGCGCGRVSRGVLGDLFANVDLVEPVSRLLNDAVKAMEGGPARTRAFNCGAEKWVPDVDYDYDAVWVQWVVMYLRDDDAIAWLRRARGSLRSNGRIFVKDNLASDNRRAERAEATFFEHDRGLCRVFSHYIDLFDAAGLTVCETIRQVPWGDDILPLYLFVLK